MEKGIKDFSREEAGAISLQQREELRALIDLGAGGPAQRTSRPTNPQLHTSNVQQEIADFSLPVVCARYVEGLFQRSDYTQVDFLVFPLLQKGRGGGGRKRKRNAEEFLVH